MKAESLVVFPRTLTGRTGIKKLRAEKRVPAVIYGSKTAPRNLEIEQKAIEHLYESSVSEILLVEITIDGEKESPNHLVMIQGVQHHPLTGKILHVDMREVSKDEEVEINVPIESEGIAVGVEAGCVLDHALQKVRLKGSVIALPEVIIVNVTALNQGDVISVKDIKVPAGVKIMADPELTVFTVTMPAEVPEEPETPVEGEEGAEMAEPEVIREKKPTDEEAGAEDDKKGGKKSADAEKKGGKKAEKK